MLEKANSGVISDILTSIKSEIILAEPTTPDPSNPLSGALYFTDTSLVYSSFIDNGNLIPQTTLLANAGGLEGTVSSVEYKMGSNLSLGVSKVTVSRSSGNSFSPRSSGLIRVGGSWLSYTSFTIESSSRFVLLGINVALFGSTNKINIGSRVLQVSTDNKVKGFLPDTVSLALPRVEQDTLETFSFVVPPSSADPSGLSVGEVDTFYTVGAPCPGLVVANLLTSYYNGVLKIWLTNPGNSSSEFFLNNGTSSQIIPYKDFWVKDSVSSQVYLGRFDVETIGFVQIQIVLNGSFSIYQRQLGGLNSLAGSFIFSS
jgi:hypothetical protein